MQAQLDLGPLQRWLRQTPDVAAAWLFGSRARGDHHANSDVDLAILTIDPVGATLKQRLGWLVDCAAALRVPIDDVDVVDLRRAPALLAVAALHDGRLLVDCDRDARVAFTVRALHRAEEARHLRTIAQACRRARVLGPRPGVS